MWIRVGRTTADIWASISRSFCNPYDTTFRQPDDQMIKNTSVSIFHQNTTFPSQNATFPSNCYFQKFSNCGGLPAQSFAVILPSVFMPIALALYTHMYNAHEVLS